MMTNHSDFVVDVEKLNKSFAGKPAVIDASLHIKKGEIFGFLGPNGSGKTTTIRMLCGLLTPDSGHGTCIGYDVLKDSAIIKKHVGYMTQKFSLYEDLSIEENLDFIGRLYQIKKRKNKVTQALHDLGLYQRRKQLAGQLSGGWKQRLALSAALIHEPQLLLLDEPTAGVDPEARREFWDQVHLLASQGITTLVSTHYMDEAERCTRLAYIAYGNMLCQGSADEIIQQSQLTTWSITSDNAYQIKQTLEANPAVSQVVIFGQSLHVSGQDKKALEQSIKQLQLSSHDYKEIATGLEDVFIYLVNQNMDARHHD